MPVDRGSFSNLPSGNNDTDATNDNQAQNRASSDSSSSEVDPSVQLGISNVHLDSNSLNTNRRWPIPPPVWNSVVVDPNNLPTLGQGPLRNRVGWDSYRVRLPIRFSPHSRYRNFANNNSTADNDNTDNNHSNDHTSAIRFVSQDQNTIIDPSTRTTPQETIPVSSPLNSLDQNYFPSYDDDSYYNCFNGEQFSSSTSSSIIDLQPVVFSSNIFKIHMGHSNTRVSELIKEFGLMNFMNDTIVHRRLAHIDGLKESNNNGNNINKQFTHSFKKHNKSRFKRKLQSTINENDNNINKEKEDSFIKPPKSLESSFTSPGSSFHFVKEGIKTNMKIMKNNGRVIQGIFVSGEANLQFEGEIIDFENLDLRPNSKFGIEASIFNNLLRNTLCYDKRLNQLVGRHTRQYMQPMDHPKWKPFYLTDFGYLKTNIIESDLIKAPIKETKFPPSSIFHKVEHSCGNKGFCYKSLAKWFDLPPFNDFNKLPAPPTPPGKRINKDNNPENILICSNCQNTILNRFILMKIEIDIEDFLKDPLDLSKDLKIKNDLKFKNRRKIMGNLINKNNVNNNSDNNNNNNNEGGGNSNTSPRGFAFGTLRGTNSRNSDLFAFDNSRNFLSNRRHLQRHLEYNRILTAVSSAQNPNFSFNNNNNNNNNNSNNSRSTNGLGDSTISSDSDVTSDNDGESSESVFVYEISSSESDDNENNEDLTNDGIGFNGDEDEEDEDELINIELSSGRSRRLESLLFDTDLTLEQQHHRRKAVSATKLYKNGKGNKRLKLNLFCSINRLTGELCLVPGNLDKNNWSSDANDGSLFEDSASFIKLYNLFNETDDDINYLISAVFRNDIGVTIEKKRRVQKLLLLNLLTNPRLYNNLSSTTTTSSPSSSPTTEATSATANEPQNPSIYPTVTSGGKYKRSNKRLRKEDGGIGITVSSNESKDEEENTCECTDKKDDDEDDGNEEESEMDEKLQVKLLLSRYFSETKSIVDMNKVLVFKPKAQDSKAPVNCMGSFYSFNYA